MRLAEQAAQTAFCTNPCRGFNDGVFYRLIPIFVDEWSLTHHILASYYNIFIHFFYANTEKRSPVETGVWFVLATILDSYLNKTEMLL